MYRLIIRIMELTPNQFTDLMQRFPNFELSYETVSHKKVSISYNICLAIPQGKKYYAWFTFQGEKDCCFLFELNREKKITKGFQIEIEFQNKLELGTVVYGTVIEEENNRHVFIIEDIFYYKGFSLRKSNFSEKLGYSQDFIKFLPMKFDKKNTLIFSLPVCWDTQHEEDYESTASIPNNISDTIPYPIHHIQYRCLIDIKPYLNVVLTRKINLGVTTTNVISENKKVSSHVFDTIPLNIDFNRPQYRYPTVFQVTADIQFDIYHLFAYGKNCKPVYYNVAYIPNYKTSVFMNGLFRKIKENTNLDYIEESEDEEEFQDTSEDKFVDIQKVLLMECVFNIKFKKWVPIRVVNENTRVVNITSLCHDISNNTSRVYSQEKQRFHRNYNGGHNNNNNRKNPHFYSKN